MVDVKSDRVFCSEGNSKLSERMMRRFGTITPSSNVVVEQITQAVLRDFPEVTAHFSRIPYAGTTDPFPDDYDWDGMLGAARLLEPARMEVICWNGSKGGIIGFDKDRDLCRRLEELTTAKATTSTIVLDEQLRAIGASKIAFVTPYRQVVIDRIVNAWSAEGYECVAALGADMSDNYSYSELAEERMIELAFRAAEQKPEAIVFYCTNMASAPLVKNLENSLGLPVYDSVSAAVWKCLRMLGCDTASASRWGSLFSRR